MQVQILTEHPHNGQNTPHIHSPTYYKTSWNNHSAIYTPNGNSHIIRKYPQCKVTLMYMVLLPPKKQILSKSGTSKTKRTHSLSCMDILSMCCLYVNSTNVVCWFVSIENVLLLQFVYGVTKVGNFIDTGFYQGR